jgi:hypothetical protein
MADCRDHPRCRGGRFRRTSFLLAGAFSERCEYWETPYGTGTFLERCQIAEAGFQASGTWKRDKPCSRRLTFNLVTAETSSACSLLWNHPPEYAFGTE